MTYKVRESKQHLIYSRDVRFKSTCQEFFLYIYMSNGILMGQDKWCRHISYATERGIERKNVHIDLYTKQGACFA